MRKVHNILIVFKSDRPSQGVIVAGVLSFHGILVVADIAATSDPAPAAATGLGL